jgi:hypothetical protein
MVTWCRVRNRLGWPKSPTSIKNFQENFLENAACSSNSFLWWIIAGVGWSLWKTRNDLFSKIIVKTRKQIAYKSLGFLKQWIKLEKAEDLRKKEAMVLKMQEGLASW